MLTTVWRMADAPPLDPDSDTARQWVTDEWGPPRTIQPSLIERIQDFLRSLFDNEPGGSTAPATLNIVRLLVALVLIAVVAFLIYYVVRNMRDTQSAGAASGSVLEPGDLRSASALAEAARQALAAGNWSLAVLEAYRSIAKSGSERNLLGGADSLTAEQVAGELAVSFSEQRADLYAAASEFNSTRYGGMAASAAQATHAVELQQTLAKKRPRLEVPA